MNTDKKNIRLQIWITIIATLVPIITTIIINITQEKVKKLTVYYSDPDKLIKQDKGQFEKLKVYYDSSLVQNITIQHLVIKNSGDFSITKDDFIDSPITFQVSSEVKKLNNLPNILDILLIDNAEQQNSQLIINPDRCSFSYKPSLLNSGEQVKIDLLIPDKLNYKINCIGKIKDGNMIKLLSINEIEKPSRFEQFVTAMKVFFVSKWISVVICLLFSILILLGGIGFIYNTQDDNTKEFNLNLFGWIIGILILIIGVIFVGLTVALIIL